MKPSKTRYHLPRNPVRPNCFFFPLVSCFTRWLDRTRIEKRKRNDAKKNTHTHERNRIKRKKTIECCGARVRPVARVQRRVQNGTRAIGIFFFGFFFCFWGAFVAPFCVFLFHCVFFCRFRWKKSRLPTARFHSASPIDRNNNNNNNSNNSNNNSNNNSASRERENWGPGPIIFLAADEIVPFFFSSAGTKKKRRSRNVRHFRCAVFFLLLFVVVAVVVVVVDVVAVVAVALMDFVQEIERRRNHYEQSTSGSNKFAVLPSFT